MSSRRSKFSHPTAAPSAGKIARLREKTLRLRDRIKRSNILSFQRHEARLAWWQRAFRTPMTCLNWVYSSSAAMWSALMSFLGLTSKPTTAFARRHGEIVRAKKQHFRGLMHENLEGRRLLTIGISVPVAGDNIVNSLEKDSVMISGTSDIAPGGSVTVLVNDTNISTPAVSSTVPVGAGGTWSTNLNLSGLDDLAHTGGTTGLSIQAFGTSGSPATPVYIGKDTVAPQVELPLAITSDDVINIAESSAVSVIGGSGAEPNSNVTITFTSTSGPAFSQSVTVQSDAGGFFNSLLQPVNLSGLQTGQTLSVTAVSADAAQNVGSDARTITLDLTAPPAPVISTPTAGQIFNNIQADTVVVSGTGAIPGGAVQLVFTGPGANQVSAPSVQAAANGSYTFPAVNISALNDGNVTVSVSNVDSAGNPGTSQVIIKLDQTGPTLTLNTVGGNGVVDAVEAPALVISGTSSDPGTTVNVSVTDGTNTVTGSAVVTAGGTFATTGLNVSSLNDGTITVTLTSSDLNGNPAAPVMGTATKDASPPPIQITTPIAGNGIVNLSEANPFAFTITGIDTSSPAGTYTISGAGSTPIIGAIPNSSGSFTVSGLNLTVFNNGTLTIAVTQTDSNGNFGTDTKTVTLDKTAPTAPSITAATINPNAVNVPLPASGLTKDNTITYSGTAPESGTVTLFANGVAVGSAATTVSGTANVWTITTSALADGTYTVTAKLADAAGNPSPSSTAFSPNAIVDTAAPSVTIATPTAGQVFNASAIAAGVTATGTASDAVSVTLVFSSGASQVTSTAVVTAGAPNTWAKSGINLSALPDGNVAILITATDAAGNSQSITSSIVKDTVASTPVIATPIGGSDNIVNISEANALVIQGAGAEPGLPVTLTFTKGATSQTVIIPAANAGGGFISAPITLAAGFAGEGASNIVTVTASTTDVNNNTSTGSATFVLDRVAPNPIKTADSWGADGINAAEQTKITVAGSGAEPGRPVVITFNDGNLTTPAVVKTVNAIASGVDIGKFALVDPASSANLSSLDDGPITITITSADAAGNSTTLTLPTVIKDAANPLLTINDPTMGDNRINASEQTAVFIDGLASGTGTALVGNLVNIQFKDSANATVNATASVLGTGYMISPPVSLSGLAEGNITITVSATDVAGNPGSVSKTVTKDTIAPTLVVTSPTAGALLGPTQSAGLVVTGTVSEANATVNVQISDGVNPPVFRTVTATGTNFTLASNPAVLTGLNDGALTITVNAVDAAGNSATQTLGVTKDTTAPVVSITTPVSNGNNLINASEVSSVVIAGTVSGLAGAITPVTVTFSDGTSTVTKSANTNAAGAFTSPSADLSGLLEGPITITASVTDAAGNTGSDTETATKDVAPPSLVISTVASDDVINATEQAALVITGTVGGADPGAGVQLSINGTINQTVPIVAGAYTWTLSAGQLAALAAIPDGTLVISAAASDLAGNNASVTRSVLKDATLPGLTITANQYAGGISSGEAATFSLTGTVSDATPNNGNMVGQTVTIVLRDVNNTPATTDVTLTGTVVAGTVANTFVFATTPTSIASLNNGDINVFSATVTDKAGNTRSLASNSITYALDKVTPPAPAITGANGGSLSNGSLTPDNTPLINGTVAQNGTGVDSWNNNVGATVEVSVDGSVLGTTTVGAGGAFSYQVTTPLNDGVRVFTAKVTDVAGNASGASNSFSLQIDTIAPNLVITSPVTPDNKVNLVESQALVINGTGADPGMTVSITVNAPNGSLTQTAIANASGGYSSTFNLTPVATNVASGNIIISATATDLAGNTGLSPSVTVPIDTVSPAPVILAPIEVDNLVNAIEMLDVFVQGSSAEPDRPVIVTFTDSTNATITKTVVASGTGAFSLSPAVNLADLSSLVDGPITVSATSLDLFGNVGSDSKSITLDRVAPNIQITEPISTNGYVNQSEAPTFSFVLTNFVNTENIVVKLTDSVAPGAGGPNMATVTLIPGQPGYPASSGMNAGKIEINLNALPGSVTLVDGTITLAVTNEDTAGNTGSDTVTFVLDRVPPTISIDNIGAIEGDNLINAVEAQDVVITGQTNLPNTQVTVTFSDTSPASGAGATADVVKTVTTDATGKFTLATNPANIVSQVNGAITITATIKDLAENSTSASTVATLDKAIAQITIADPVAGNNVINGVEAGAVIVSGANAEPNRPVVVVFADQDAGTADVSRTVTADGSGNWTLATNLAGLGSLTDTDNLVITATTSDPAGNTSSATKTVKLDKTAPAVQIAAPAAGSYVTGSTVVVSGSGAEPNAQVTITIVGPNTSRTATVTASATGTYTNSFSLAAVTTPAMSAFDDGNLNLNVSTPDAAGNVGTALRTVIIDRVNPTAPTVVVTSNTVASLADQSITNDNTLVISGTGLDSGGTAANKSPVATVEILNGSTVLGTATITGSTYSFTTAALADGNYNFRVRVTDAAGNSTTTTTNTKRVEIDTVAPTINVQNTISGDDLINASEAAAGVPITGTTLANVAVTVTVIDMNNVSLAKSTTSDGSGNFTVNLTPADFALLANGQLTFIGETTDAANNTGFDVEIATLDVVAPAITITSHTAGGVINASQAGAVNVTGVLSDNGAVNNRPVVVTISDGTTSKTATVNTGASSGAYALGAGLALNITTLADGPITIKVDSSDKAGNPISKSIPLTKDTTSVTPTITTPIELDGVVSATEQTTVEIFGTNAEPGRPVTVVFSIGANSLTTFGAANGAGAYALNAPFDISSLPDGTITVTVTTTDASGNSGSNSTTIVKDTTAPVVTTSLLTANFGGTKVIAASNLSSIDNISTAANVSYSVTTAPTVGFLALVGNPTVQINTFTQQQINSGQVVYVSLGNANVFADSFAFSVSDAAGNVSTGTLNVSLTMLNLPKVESVALNGGQAQRSKLKTIEITFDQQVVGATVPGAIVVQRRADNAATPGAIVGSVPQVGMNVTQTLIGSGSTAKTKVTITFLAGNTYVDSTGSLDDGNYQVVVNAGLVTSLAGGFALDGDNDGFAGGNYVFGNQAKDRFFRMFGELDGGSAATGVSFVDSFDAGAFLSTYLMPANYDQIFDLNEDGSIDAFDAGAFLANYLKARNLNGFAP